MVDFFSTWLWDDRDELVDLYTSDREGLITGLVREGRGGVIYGCERRI